MLKNISFFILLLLLSSCGSETSKTEEEAAQKAAALFGAESCKLEHVNNGGSHEAMRVSVSNLTKSGKNPTADKITSTLALTFFQGLAPEDTTGFDQIMIRVTGKPLAAEQTYAISDLKMTSELIGVCAHFFEALRTNPENARAYVAGTNVPDSSLTNVGYAIHQTETQAGAPPKTVFTGFRFDKFNNQPIAIIWMQARSGTVRTQYTFYVSTKSKKVMYIGME